MWNASVLNLISHREYLEQMRRLRRDINSLQSVLKGMEASRGALEKLVKTNSGKRKREALSRELMKLHEEVSRLQKVMEMAGIKHK